VTEIKKPTPIYLFVVILSLAIASFGFFLLFINLGPSGYIVPVIAVVILIGFFMYIAKAINTSQFEQKLEIKRICPSCKEEIYVIGEFCPKCGVNIEEKTECEYCGHMNPFDAKECQKCNANLK